MARPRSIIPIFLFVSFFSARSWAQEPVELELVPWAQGLVGAVDITHAGDHRLFVARQWGAISIITDSMQIASPLFLDITDQVLYSGERGLLGLAFDPDYATNGYFYLNYVTGSGNGVSRISRFQVSANPNVADPASEVVLLSMPQPDPIHNGGGLVFGPDGYLYVAFGDGGGSGDPNSNGQDPGNLFGAVLRIKPEPDGTYSIPPDNPFVGSPNGEREEVWAYGLRNPFRIGIDPLNGDLWVGDVGQQLWEEINRWPGGDNSGPNFGWSCNEGFEIFNAENCVQGVPTEQPVTVQAHAVNGGDFCAIVAGEVYRGSRYPNLYGRFLYTDYCTGGIRTLTDSGQGSYVDQPGVAVAFPGMSSIGADTTGELYVTNLSQGKVFKIIDKCPMDRPEILADGDDLSTSEGAAYAWTFQGEPIPGGDEQTITVIGSGYYAVTVTYANGCVRTSVPYFHISTGMESNTASGLRVFPQPAAGTITIERGQGAMEPWTVNVLDAIGRSMVIITWPEALERLDLDASSLPAGPYSLIITGRSERIIDRRLIAVAR